jgi:hypothetical protein
MLEKINACKKLRAIECWVEQTDFSSCRHRRVFRADRRESTRNAAQHAPTKLRRSIAGDRYRPLASTTGLWRRRVGPLASTDVWHRLVARRSAVCASIEHCQMGDAYLCRGAYAQRRRSRVCLIERKKKGRVCRGSGD